MLPVEKLNGENNGVKQENSESDEQDNGLINQEDMEKLELEEQTSSETEVFYLSRKHPVSDEAFHQHPNQRNPTKLYWPAEILTEILSRIPVKSFLRFKSVIKSWSSLISSPEFTKYHLSLSANNNKDYTNHIVMWRIGQQDFNLKECPVTMETNLDYHMKKSGIACVIEGSVNGLICLVNEAKELFVWNPAIRKYKMLRDFRTKLKDDGKCTYGFGFDDIHDDYKAYDYCWKHQRDSHCRHAGYCAPELSKIKNSSDKTDVYILRVIILELLTGKSPSEAMDGLDLPQWVASIVKEEGNNEVFDVELMRDAPNIGDKLFNTLKWLFTMLIPHQLLG
ncbi:hypothetical protein T459_20911 [Capsicum annuum]|uniref:F-box domain-containing protein n=1 Tax=Capsicum annuum TaxID=4072 RepID=A0A2G2Z5Y9_CAPAN|nr:hypothetical protein T459_20911 [Capsicum annuum]